MSLDSAIADAIDDRLLDVHTAIPGRVQTYDVATQTADVQPLLRVNGELLPVLPKVPIAFPRSGGAFLSFPIAAGDFVFVVFAEQSIGAWRALGGGPTAPGDLRRHPLDGAVALPCCYPNAKALANAHSSDVVLGHDAGVRVYIKPSEVDIGSENASDFVALAAKVATELARIKSDLQTLQTAISSAPTTPNDGGASFKAGLVSALSGWPSDPASVAASKLKSD